MQKDYLVALDEFCTMHNVEISFIRSLQENGLIRITDVQEKGFIDTDQLGEVEKYILFHYDLEINIEGIETITHLLQRIKGMQEEITTLKNRLLLYES
jgi:hypothetical protein